MSYKTYKKDILLKRGRNRKARPKTFSSEEAASKYAEEHGIKSFELVNIKSIENSEKKLRIVVK
jgi:hypothetical protein